MSKSHLVRLGPYAIGGIRMDINDLKESREYLEWIMRSKKRRAETFETHEAFIDALIGELHCTINALESIIPETKT